ncbi:MAG TPA: galactokinase [Propionibacteriaceae bacterium]|nr:galactokinase [Propionibacteriaceae bacterium]
MTSSLDARVAAVAAAFEERFGYRPTGVWRAPGRVNLIGEHTDYNDGFVLPFALEQSALVAAAPRGDQGVRISSLDLGETHELSVDEIVPGSGGWQAYLAGTLWALREAGHPAGGLDLVLSSDVPVGAGLSSSAAIECAVMAAAVDLFDLDLSPLDRARLCQRAENAYVGAPTGLLDQAASTLCTAGHALFLDCRSFDSRQVPLPLREAGLEILVLDTHTPHTHVDGEYAARRGACEEAARRLGVPALRDVVDLPAALALLDDDLLRRRVRHVVTEDARVLETVELASDGRLEQIAPLLDASHASMRDDFEITVETVDTAVETARAAGALGARMTGGGFGGCIIALCREGAGDAVGAAVAAEFARRGFNAPTWFVAHPADGAGRVG